MILKLVANYVGVFPALILSILILIIFISMAIAMITNRKTVKQDEAINHDDGVPLPRAPME